MRLAHIYLVGLALTASGCPNNPVGLPDLAGQNNDLSVQLDMSSSDLSGAGDMTMLPPDLSTGMVTFSKFQIDLANAKCAREVVCGQLPSDATSLANCFDVRYAPPSFDLDTEIAKGRIEVNEAQCLAAVGNQRCDHSDVGFISARCGNSGTLLVPHQTVGGACIVDAECISGYCAHGNTDAGTLQPSGCLGMCAAFKTTGAACVGNVECNAVIATCTGNMCTPRSDANQACTLPNNCKAGLYCPSFSQTPTCQMPAMQMMTNGPCDPLQGQFTTTPPCALGLYCQLQYADGGSTPIGATCQPKVASGNPCKPTDVNGGGNFNFLALDSPCQDGTSCFTTGAPGTETCQPLGTANATCSASETSCADTYSCTAGHCVSKVATGSPCPTVGTGNQCASNSCGVATSDAGSAGMCVTRKGFGASCQPGVENALCGADQCTPAGGGGGVCTPRCN
jgi:hypothetical protein